MKTTPRILNFGSINIDHVYHVPHFVRPGETLSSEGYRQHPGGKGLNQSLALAHAGVNVFHAGFIAENEGWLKALLNKHAVSTQFIREHESLPTGHAIIQVTPEGENSIIIHGGCNQAISREAIEDTVKQFGINDCLLVQNEINRAGDIIRLGKAQGMTVFFAPAPMTDAVHDFPLDCVDFFILNEIEAGMLTGQGELDAILDASNRLYPDAAFVVTLGDKGAVYKDQFNFFQQEAETVKVVDTTAAGDTFTGFFIAEWLRSKAIERALSLACRAAALCVGIAGAADSIPYLKDVLNGQR